MLYYRNYKPISYWLNQIHTGSMRRFLPRIPSQSVDIVFTSPPYGVGLEYENYRDVPDRGFWYMQYFWLRQALRITKNGGRLYIVVGDTIMWDLRCIAINMGWNFHQLLTWCKPNLANTKRISKDWNTTVEWGLLFHKGKRTPMKKDVSHATTHNWIVATAPQSNFNGTKKKVFVAQMSLKVALSWLSRTPGQIVLDPFAGSGITLRAAKMLQRDWIGIEIGPRTADMARYLISQDEPLLDYSQVKMGLA